ncbi:hypothetical protein CN928_22965, partial [Bacillus thuringiensis]
MFNCNLFERVVVMQNNLLKILNMRFYNI